MATRAASTATPPRTAAKATPAKKATPKAAPAAKTEVESYTVELEHVGTTKSYEKFAVPETYKGTMAGNVYAPIGTKRVAIRISSK